MHPEGLLLLAVATMAMQLCNISYPRERIEAKLDLTLSFLMRKH